MALHRVPGVRNYLADDSGLAVIGRSSKMGAVMVDRARAVASAAESAGESDYGVQPRTVTAGWRNEKRAGAVVVESVPSWSDMRDEVLKRTSAAMSRRMR